jgi:WD40 repeat protein
VVAAPLAMQSVARMMACVLVTASNDGTAIIWEVPSGRLLSKLAPLDGIVSTAVFSAGGKRVLTASVTGRARLWDIESGVPVGMLPASDPLREWLISGEFVGETRIATTHSIAGILNISERGTSRSGRKEDCSAMPHAQTTGGILYDARTTCLVHRDGEVAL